MRIKMDNILIRDFERKDAQLFVLIFGGGQTAIRQQMPLCVL